MYKELWVLAVGEMLTCECLQCSRSTCYSKSPGLCWWQVLQRPIGSHQVECIFTHTCLTKLVQLQQQNLPSIKKKRACVLHTHLDRVKVAKQIARGCRKGSHVSARQKVGMAHQNFRHVHSFCILLFKFLDPPLMYV